MLEKDQTTKWVVAGLPGMLKIRGGILIGVIPTGGCQGTVLKKYRRNTIK